MFLFRVALRGKKKKDFWKAVGLRLQVILSSSVHLPGALRQSDVWWFLSSFSLVLIHDSKKAEEPEIKLPTSTGSSKKQEIQKNIYFCFIDYAKAFDCVDHKKLWKILKEMGIPDHLICLLRNVDAGQEATVRSGHGTTDWFQIGKGVHQGCILSPCLFNLYAECIMRWSISWNQDCREKYQ